VYGSSTLAHRIKLFRASYQFHVPMRYYCRHCNALSLPFYAVR
jgi:hypothetical protein